MPKLLGIVAVVFASLFFAASGFAVPPGQTVESSPRGAGKVIFSGTVHAEKGAKCTDCPTALFPDEEG
jgi:hypothetical protein